MLIHGEQGSGKKFVAEKIHRQSRRRAGPLAMIRTEPIMDPCWEEELFGTPGRGGFAAAQGGSLLIEEITQMPRTCQAMLLEIAEDRQSVVPEYQSNRHRGFRLMATTRYDPSESVKRGTMREDLYYRLAVITIRVPPLRERREDTPMLIHQLLKEICEELGKPVPSVSTRLMDSLVNHPWPGNARQLGECLGEMVSEQDVAVLDNRHLPDAFSCGGSNSGNIVAEPVGTLAELERAAVMRALKFHQGNRTRTAHSLGISVRTLQRKLRQWGI